MAPSEHGAERVGILGGTFDPPHVAHLVCASAAATEARLDRTILVVAGDPYQKVTVAGPEDRYEMTKLAVAGHPTISVSRIELDRPGPTYTIDTIARLKAAEPGADFWFIAGSDAIADIRTWHECERLVDEVGFAVVPRPGAPIEDAMSALGGSARVIVVESGPNLDVSSIDVRCALAEGLPVDHLLESDVEAYIRKHGLYV